VAFDLITIHDPGDIYLLQGSMVQVDLISTVHAYFGSLGFEISGVYECYAWETPGVTML
jgi:hypothetical protein